MSIQTPDRLGTHDPEYHTGTGLGAREVGYVSLLGAEDDFDPRTIEKLARDYGRTALDAADTPTPQLDEYGRTVHVYPSEAIYTLAKRRLRRTGHDRRLGPTESEPDAIRAVIDRLCWANNRYDKIIQLQPVDLLDEQRLRLWIGIGQDIDDHNKEVRSGGNAIRDDLGLSTLALPSMPAGFNLAEHIASQGPGIGISPDEVVTYMEQCSEFIKRLNPNHAASQDIKNLFASRPRHLDYMHRVVPEVHEATDQQYENFNSTACDWIVAQALLGPVYLHVNDGDYTRSTGLPLESNDLPAAILQQQRLGRDVHPIYIVNKDISPDQARDCPALRVREAGPDGVRARLEADGSKTLILDISSAYIDGVKAQESATGVPYDDIMARRLDQYAKSGIDRIEISVNRTDFFDPRAIGWRRQAAEIVQNVNAARDAEMRASSRKPLSSRPNGTVHYEATRSAPFEIFILNGEATQAERDRAQKEILRRSVAVTPLARRAERRGGILESRTNERIVVRSYGGTWRQDTAEADLYRRISDWALAA